MTFFNAGTTGCARVVCRPGTVCRESSVGVLCPVLGTCKKKVECVPEGKTNFEILKFTCWAIVKKLMCVFVCLSQLWSLPVQLQLLQW